MFETPVLFFNKLRKEHPTLTQENFWQRLHVTTDSEDTKLLHALRFGSEFAWRDERQPYYKVYPKILSALCRVNLNLPVTSIHYPVQTLMVLLPKGQTELVMNNEQPLIGMLVRLRKIEDKGLINMYLSPYVHDMPMQGIPTGLSFCCEEGETVEEALSKPYGNQSQEEFDRHLKFTRSWVRLAVALSLLGDDTDVIVPDILEKDVNRGVNADTVRRAVQRGKIGWLVGRDIEMSPHVRIPHLFHACVGPGGKQRKLMWRKGSIIHRDKIASIPTGFQGNTAIAPTS